MLIRTAYLQQIKPFINTEMIKVLTGIRRSGKSVLLNTIAKEIQNSGVPASNIHLLNFESELIPDLKTFNGTLDYIHSLLHTNGKHYLLLDEVQELTGWEKIINSVQIDFDVDLYITGSNAKLLSGELATYLAGRYVEFKVYPFSFAEMMALAGQQGAPMDAHTGFNKYLTLGGMPVIYHQQLQGTTASQYLQDVYSSVILKDIVARNKVRNVELLQRIVLFLISNIGNQFTAASIVKYLKSANRNVSTETIYNYLDYCSNACFLHLVPAQDLKGKNILSRHDKIYLVDHGLREAIYGSNVRDIGQTLENIVFVELLRRGYKVTVGKLEGKEVDFVATRANDKLYVQVCYLLASDETREREFGVLERIEDNYPKLVLSLDEFDFSQNGIQHKNLLDYLLNA